MSQVPQSLSEATTDSSLRSRFFEIGAGSRRTLMMNTINSKIIVFCEGGYNGAKDIQPAIQYRPH